MTTKDVQGQAVAPRVPMGEHRGGLAVLALATFIVVTTEMLPVGLLSAISTSLEVSESRTGMLLTAYAFTVAMTATALTSWTASWPRKRLLLAVVGIFAVGAVLSGAATNFALLAVARLVCGAAHGVFWSIVAGYAAALASTERPGRATAVVFAGNSGALVLGVPLTAALGGTVGWRAAFWLVAFAALLVLTVAMRVLPPVPGNPQQAGRGPHALRLPGLLPLVMTTMVLVLGHFTLYSYVTPLLHSTGIPDGAGVSALLATYGVTGLGGTWLAGLWVDRAPSAAIFGTTGAMALAIGLLAFGASLIPVTVAAVAVWGMAFAAAPVCLQATVLRIAGTAHDTASSWYVAAFNLGIGGGALAGGAVLASAGVRALGWVALAAVSIAAAIAWGSSRHWCMQDRKVAP
ncbi:MFS transporter [Streptomyces sp. NBRC 110028]|uniref:MFS transporter n=1 Tax=Streptomyces sp. NBRC 110028 TaxID=1621260 RepID=UPI000B2C08BC|nr:MFS transporter [Streptomyces sp. NBRC 110028]